MENTIISGGINVEQQSFTSRDSPGGKDGGSITWTT